MTPPYHARIFGDSIRPRVPSTFRASYHEAFSAVKPRLKKDGGKVVFTSAVAVYSKDASVWIAEEYFALTDSTFRYLCFTPETGVWLGPTPEVLLESLLRAQVLSAQCHRRDTSSR